MLQIIIFIRQVRNVEIKEELLTCFIFNKFQRVWSIGTRDADVALWRVDRDPPGLLDVRGRTVTVHNTRDIRKRTARRNADDDSRDWTLQQPKGSYVNAQLMDRAIVWRHFFLNKAK